jgi:TM2 domain-containing membrane protein YozV
MKGETPMGLTTNGQLLIENRVTNGGKNIIVAYLLSFFLGVFSAHRFYLGRPGSAILQILSYLVLIGFVWLALDLFFIPGIVRVKNDALRSRLAAQLQAQHPLAA